MSLGPRWYKLDPHPDQTAYWESRKRFKLNHSGRRSGKTELVKREGVLLACTDLRYPDPQYIFAAPTLKQSRKIWWEDVKALTPKRLVDKIAESEPAIYLNSGAKIRIEGLDNPQRLEGSPIDFIAIDEASGIKDGFWGTNIRPALSTRGREGVARLLGVPRGRGYYYRLFQMAKKSDEWDVFRWSSSSILSAEEITSLKQHLDSRTQLQELEGHFVAEEGLAYYEWRDEKHIKKLPYVPWKDLEWSFDFNVDPGVATISQTITVHDIEPFSVHPEHTVAEEFVNVLGEVFIQGGTNTKVVMQTLHSKCVWHQGNFQLFGDASGGARHSAAVDGSNWDIIRNYMRTHFPGRWVVRTPSSNPHVVARLNSTNVRLNSALNEIGMFVHPRCTNLIDDFNGVFRLADGQIDKKTDEDRTHISDALGYRICMDWGYERADLSADGNTESILTLF